MSRDAIEDLVHRYADAVVRRDRAQWADTWAEDGHWDLGMGFAADGRDDIVALWSGAMSTFDAVVQTVLNGSADVDDFVGTGTGRWYIQEHGRTGTGDPFMMLSYYDDTYVRVDGRWRFASRALVSLYNGPTDLSAPFTMPSEAVERDA